MPGPIRISAEVEGAEAALTVAALLDELAGAVAAFETHAAAGDNAALWRGEAHPPHPGFDPPAPNKLAPPPARGGGGLVPGPPERLPPRDSAPPKPPPLPPP